MGLGAVDNWEGLEPLAVEGDRVSFRGEEEALAPEVTVVGG